MSRRTNQPDTQADRDLSECLRANPPRSFIMVAGAGSGKTTSLIKALAEIISEYGETLRLRRQRIACITYTEIAAGEIWTDVGNNPLVHVSTIHSFLWSIIRAFQSDIQCWAAGRIDQKLQETRDTVANFGPRVQQRTRDKAQRDIARYEQQRARIDRVRSFAYGTGSDYTNGVLGHDDIIKMVPELLIERPLLRTLLAQQYPYLLVDESQDTTENVVEALKAVDQQMGASFCLGFFGDPMQRIYPTGIGAIPLEDGWRDITKPENFRCPATVLTVANSIRHSGDGLVQIRGRMVERNGGEESVPGSAHIFVLPTDDRRDERLAQVRTWFAQRSADPAWQPGGNGADVKVLVIVHRMAAKRLGFGDLYAALNDRAPEAFKNGFLDATAWPVRPFISFVLPLAEAVRNGREFEVMQVLRNQSPLLAPDRLRGVNVAERLTELRTLTDGLGRLLADDSAATNGEVLRLLHEKGLLQLDPRILSYLNLSPTPAGDRVTDNEDDGEELSREIAAMDAFLACRATQFWGYRTYVNNESPFSTQQGIKGAEFERVLVVLDDDEGTHVQFSYDKYLGIKPLSDRDQANIRDGKETSVDRTRRLFYVCCTRALQDLGVVLFSADAGLAERRIRALGTFPSNSIHTLETLEAM
jgi:DNA helicase II / ATP-dependent DNA helicase PcrA